MSLFDDDDLQKGNGSNPKVPKKILDIVRTAMPSMIAQDLVGVQPMSGAVGNIFKMRPRYSGLRKQFIKDMFKKSQKSDNNLIKLRGLKFKQYLQKFKDYETVKIDLNKTTVIEDDFDCFFLGKPDGHDDNVMMFAPAEVCTLLALKYDGITRITPSKENYFSGMHMVRNSSGLDLDGKKLPE